MNTFSKLIFFVSICLAIFSCSNAQKLSEKEEEYISKTVEFFNNQNYDSALYYSNKILEKSPKNVNVWLTKGRSLFFLSKYSESIKAFDKAVELNSKDNEIKMYRGISHRFNENYRKALEDFDFVLNTEPKKITALAQKAVIHYHFREYQQSIVTYAKLFELDLDQMDVYLNRLGRAKVYIKMKKFDLAEKDIDIALGTEIERGSALEIKSSLLMEKEDYVGALEIAEETLVLARLNPNLELRKELVPYSYNNLGYLKHKVGKTDEGIKDIMYSLELMPKNSYAYKHLALISFDLDKKKEGCQYIEKALELGFTNMFGNEMEELKQEKCEN